MMFDDDDDGVEPHIKAVDEYYFEFSKEEPICFSILPFQFNENDKVGDYNLEKKVYLRGIVDKSLYRLHKEVVSWRLGQLDYEQPNISVLSSEGNWIELLNPRKCYKNEVARSIFITIQMIHFVKKHHTNRRSLWDRLWDHLNEVFDELDPLPTMDDLRNHHFLIKLFIQRDSTLMKLKIMHRFSWDNTETTKKPKTSSTKVHLVDNDGSCTRNNGSGSDCDDYDNDDDSNYDHSDDSDYDVHDDSDYTDDNDNYNEYDTYDEDDNSDDGNDTLCALCDDGGKLISCIGQCKRSFHPRNVDGKESKCKTLGYTSTQLKEMDSFICKNCEYKQHQCFKCGDLEPSAEPNAKVFKCNNPTCGHFYHPKCVAKLLEPDDSNGDGSCKLERRIMEGMSFTCPMHWCYECGGLENQTPEEMKFAMCRRCPKSYHIKCLPREISFETKDRNIEQRAWNLFGIVIIYCLDHKICKATGNAKRDHIKFPQTSKTVKVQDLAKQKGKMVAKRKRNADQCSVKSLMTSNKLPRTKIDHTQNSLQDMVLKPEGSTMGMKEDLQSEASMAAATNQTSQITLKWQEKQPRSSLSLVMRTRMLSSDVGSKTKKRNTSRPKKERSLRKSHNIAKKCVEPPIQIANNLHPHLEPGDTDNLLEDPRTYKDTEPDNVSGKIPKDNGRKEKSSMHSGAENGARKEQESISTKRKTARKESSKSRCSNGGFAPYHVGDDPPEKLPHIPHVGNMVITNTIHTQALYACDKDQEVNGGLTFQDDTNSYEYNVSPKEMSIDTSSDKSRTTKLKEKATDGNKTDLDGTKRCNHIEDGKETHCDHSSHQCGSDHKEQDYHDHSCGNTGLGGPQCNDENEAAGISEYKSEQSTRSSRREKLTSDKTENSSDPLVGINSHMEQRNYSPNEQRTYYDRYQQHHPNNNEHRYEQQSDVNYSSNGNYGPWIHVSLRQVRSPTEFDANRRHDPYSYQREFQHDITRCHNLNFHPRNHGYFIGGWPTSPYYPTRPMHADYAPNTNNFMHIGYNARGIAPTPICPPLQLNNNGANQPHAHGRMQGRHGAAYGEHSRDYGVRSHYTLNLGPYPRATRSVMDKYAPNLEQTNNQVHP